MIFTVNAALPADIVIGATGLQGLAQEVRTVLTTRKGSVPLDRDFGMDWTVVDQPVGGVLPTLVADVATQVEKYVPRVEVLSVRFEPESQGKAVEEAMDGILRPVVRCRIKEEYRNDFI